MPAIVDELAHLGDHQRHLEQRRVDAVVDAEQALGDARLALADDDLGRGEVVLDRRRFAQELGIERRLPAPPRAARRPLAPASAAPAGSMVPGGMVLRNTSSSGSAARRSRIAVAELARALEQMGEIELAVGARRRADADDHHVEPVELAVDRQRRCAPGRRRRPRSAAPRPAARPRASGRQPISATFSGLMSMPSTWWPALARQAAVVVPT